MKKTPKSRLLRTVKVIKRLLRDTNSRPLYRVVSVEETNKNEYEATIQITGKNIIFKKKPEEILSDDKMTDGFSPRDIRTLTYLGYLGINSPKYYVLANRLAEDEHMIFAIRKKGSKKIEMKTAQDLSKDINLIKNLNQKDAHMIGYTAASEQILDEKKQKENARLQLNKKDKKKIQTKSKL